jgi:hypothetical protein
MYSSCTHSPVGKVTSYELDSQSRDTEEYGNGPAGLGPRVTVLAEFDYVQVWGSFSFLFSGRPGSVPPTPGGDSVGSWTYRSPLCIGTVSVPNIAVEWL